MKEQFLHNCKSEKQNIKDMTHTVRDKASWVEKRMWAYLLFNKVLCIHTILVGFLYLIFLFL